LFWLHLNLQSFLEHEQVKKLVLAIVFSLMWCSVFWRLQIMGVGMY
jgi:hypothetical protein